MKEKFHLLAADIGGTNSRFALFEVLPENCTGPDLCSFPDLYLRKEHWLKTGDYKNFTGLLQALHQFSQANNFLPHSLSCACIAAPGPIEGQFCYPPNIAWTIDALEVNNILGIEQVFLINDFVAQAYACMLARSPKSRGRFELETIWLPKHKNSSSQNLPQAPVAILGAGSGLGKAIILETAQLVLPSEGGHANFPFIGSEEFAYAEFIKQAYGIEAIENEQIISGCGLARLYDYHARQRELPHAQEHAQPDNLLDEDNGIKKPKRSSHEVSAILRGDISQKPEAGLTMEWYARFYGRICKNFALNSLALGGIYITGGMATRVPVLQHPAFLQSLQQSQTQKRLLEKIPLFHINSQQAGLRGAALFGALKYLFPNYRG